jgi:hypothetical protein
MTKIFNDEERKEIAISRLRQSKDEKTRVSFQQNGRSWAMERATYAELERLVRNTSADNCKTLDALRSYSRCWPHAASRMHNP